MGRQPRADDRVRPARRGPAPAVARLEHAAVARARAVGRVTRRRRRAGGDAPPADRALGVAATLSRRVRRSCARRGRLRGRPALLGPAFVAAVAYIDPGNFATNFAAGAQYGYALVWVIVVANLMAMLVQYLSAKVGVATGADLPELCRDALPRAGVARACGCRPRSVAMATDLAEFVGAAIGLNLLFGVPLFAGRADHRGRRVRRSWRWSSAATAGSSWRSPRCSALVLLGFCYDLIAVGADAGRRSRAAWCPSFAGPGSVAAGGRHHRRDGHAARGLPALGADQGAGAPAATTASGASCCGSSGSTSSSALGAGGPDQPDDAVRRGLAVPPHRRHRRRLDRGRARRARPSWSAAARRWPSRSRCWPPGCRRRASAPTPARS